MKYFAFLLLLLLPLQASASTLTVFPDPNVEVTSVDGRCYDDTSNNWATQRAQASCDFVSDSEAASQTKNSQNNGNGPLFYDLIRLYFLYDTSSLTSGAVISAATMSFHGNDKVVTGTERQLYLVSSTPAANTSITFNDFGQVGSTDFGQTTVPFNIGSYNDDVLNASGIAAISLTGISKFGLRGYYDFNNIAPVDGVSTMNDVIDMADTAGTASDPKLVITYNIPIPTHVQATFISGKTLIQAGQFIMP